mgnify:CR=1 FL=1
MNKNNQYKSIFLSDIHLGFNGCQNEKLEHFLKSVSCENLYLVGDIIDFWSMEDKFYWPEGHQRALSIFDEYTNAATRSIAGQDIGIYYDISTDVGDFNVSAPWSLEVLPPLLLLLLIDYY